MLYNGVFGCHGNTCYVIFIGAIFYIIYSTGQINVCTDFEINRFRIDEVRKYATIVYFIWRHVTQKRYVVRHGDSTLLIGILTRNILKPTRSPYAGNIVKFPFTYSYWLNGRWFLQIVDIGNVIMRLEILKSSPSLTG